MAVPNSDIAVGAGGIITYRMTTATGPDKDGYLSLESLNNNAKIAEFVQEFYISDDNGNELAAIKLPVIDLTAAVYFPLPSMKDFSTVTLGGDVIDGEYFSAHKLTMVNFWATWCGPCIDEMPDISALHVEYADQGFAVLGVLVWDEGSEDAALDFLTSSGIAYPVVAYDTVPAFIEIAGTQSGIPFSIFVDANGNQIGEIEIGWKSKKEWAAKIEELLMQVG
jgi:thiol-disulfide isomerase/thioredoxin